MGSDIEIVRYDSEWPKRFAGLGRTLRAALGDVAVRIDHIGSTAVVGLAAKAIVDIQISVPSFEPLDSYREPLERLGYVFRADNPERSYTEAKDPFIRELMGNADRWSQQVGWMPRPSDS